MTTQSSYKMRETESKKVISVTELATRLEEYVRGVGGKENVDPEDFVMTLEISVNKVNGKNQTPINIAAYKGHLGVVRFLLIQGADCTIKDQWGDTPLASARAEGHAEVAALLE